jgi:hypothetical protein
MSGDTVQTMLSDVMQVRLDSCAIKTHTSSGNVSLGMPIEVESQSLIQQQVVASVSG